MQMLFDLLVQCLLDVRMPVSQIIYSNAGDKIHVPLSICRIDVNSFGAFDLKSERIKCGLRET